MDLGLKCGTCGHEASYHKISKWPTPDYCNAYGCDCDQLEITAK